MSEPTPMHPRGSALAEIQRVIGKGGTDAEIRDVLVSAQQAGMPRTEMTVHLERIRAINSVTGDDEEVERRAMLALDLVSGYAWAARLEWPECDCGTDGAALADENARLRRAIRNARGLMDTAMADGRPGMAHHYRISADRLLALALGEKPGASVAATPDQPGEAGTVRLSEVESIVLEQVIEEIARQDAKHGPFAGTTPLGTTRLAIACLEDEVREVLEAWRAERKIAGMPHTREELIQVAVVALRAVRDCWGSK